MEVVLAIVAGGMLGASLYAFMKRGLLRLLVGFVLLSNAVNLFVFVAGRLTRGAPPLIGADAKTLTESANPLPQALMLTAIVISFSLTAFALTLAFRVFRNLETLDTDQLRIAEEDDDQEGDGGLAA